MPFLQDAVKDVFNYSDTIHILSLIHIFIASVSFGVYKNFTAIDQHTTHEKEIIELRLQDKMCIRDRCELCSR